MTALIHNSWFWIAVGLAVFSAIASSMPAPTDKSSIAYKWLYGTLHMLAANIGDVIPLLKAKLPLGVGMKTLSIFLLLIAIAFPIAAQSPTPSPTPAPSPAPAAAALPSNIYAAGLSYNSGASPEVAGTALYARLIADGSGTYAFTVVDAVPISKSPFTVSTNFGAGIAQKVFTIGSMGVFVPTSAGVAYNGSNTGWAWSTGAMLSIKLKGNFRVFPTVRVQKSSVSAGSGYQPIGGILFGWGQ